MISGKILEIACFNLESLGAAQDAGADRIELCEDYRSGGISPSLNTISIARNLVRVPLHVIVRPRPDAFAEPFFISPPENFKYSELEIQWMIQFILICKLRGVNGIVFGALTEQKEIDVKTVKRLIEAADKMSLTFHRAIDESPDLENSINTLIDLGVHRLLTSGGKKNAVDNLERIKQLQEKFGSKITLMPGGGIRSSNIKQIMESGCPEYHSAAITGNSELADASEIRKLKQLLTSSR